MTATVNRLSPDSPALCLYTPAATAAGGYAALARRMVVLAITSCLVLPGVGAAQQTPVAADPAPVFESVVSPRGEILTAQDVAVTMRDGVRISLDIYRPADRARHPALYAAGPYPHTRAILDDQSADAGPVSWYVSQGFAVVVASVRGTGLSGGDFGFFSRQEQQDHYEIIEWIATQPWSDGQVGGTGAGYYAASQWQMAIQNPPSLECIAPVNGTLDPLREWIMPGGLANHVFISGWYEEQVRLPNAFTPDASRLVNFDLRLAQLMHPSYDTWWRDRSSLESVGLINVPVFALHDWSLSPSDAGVTSTMNALAGLNVINKALVRGAAGDFALYEDTAFLARELLPYYQWCFNGRNPASPYVERARIRFQVRGQNTIKRESNWPPGNIAQQAMFLEMPAGSRLSGRLAANQAAAGPGFTNVERAQSDAPLRFVSERLDQDLEITGPVMLEMYAASTTGDMAFAVTLLEEEVADLPVADVRLPSFLATEADSPEPDTDTTRVVTHGRLKASVRQRDGARSTEYMPVYALTGNETLSPGQVYRLDIALRQTAYRFRAGNRIVLEVSPANDGSLAADGRDTLYHSTRYPTRLWLPVVRPPRQPVSGTVPSTPAGNERRTAPQAPDREPGDENNPAIFVPR